MYKLQRELYTVLMQSSKIVNSLCSGALCEKKLTKVV